jgi:hypothetical protein
VHLDRVFLMVDHKEDSLVVLLDTIDNHIRITISGTRLQNSDMVERFSVSVVKREPLPIHRGTLRISMS